MVNASCRSTSNPFALRPFIFQWVWYKRIFMNTLQVYGGAIQKIYYLDTEI
jgi:hypothetical protein